SDLEGFYIVRFWSPDRDSTAVAFAQRFQERVGYPPDQSEALTYDAVMLVGAAVRGGARSSGDFARAFGGLPQFVNGRPRAPAAAKKLAVAEDELGAIESAFGEAVARYQLGDRKGAREKLADVRVAEDRSQLRYNEAMVLALNTGVAARRAFRQSMGTLGWS